MAGDILQIKIIMEKAVRVGEELLLGLPGYSGLSSRLQVAGNKH